MKALRERMALLPFAQEPIFTKSYRKFPRKPSEATGSIMGEGFENKLVLILEQTQAGWAPLINTLMEGQQIAPSYSRRNTG